MIRRTIGVLLFALLVSGCDDVSLPSTKDFRPSKWYESGPDTILDGAMRVSTSSFKDERYLTVRCFKGTAADAVPGYDLRYTIDIPLLERVAEDLKKSTTLSVAIAVDGKAVGIYKARAGFQHEELFFLADVEESVITALAAAEKDVNVVPKEGDKKLDKIIAFSSAGLSDKVKPVMKACAKETIEAPGTAPADGIASR
jgi:hypothetical protein